MKEGKEVKEVKVKELKESLAYLSLDTPAESQILTDERVRVGPFFRGRLRRTNKIDKPKNSLYRRRSKKMDLHSHKTHKFNFSMLRIIRNPN